MFVLRLGQLFGYAAITGIFICLSESNDVVLFTMSMAVIFELCVIPFQHPVAKATIRDGVRSGQISRWLPFCMGGFAAAAWPFAMWLTWNLRSDVESTLVIAAILLLSITWMLLGTIGVVSFTAIITTKRSERDATTMDHWK